MFAPPLRAFHVDRADVAVGDSVTVSWDASNAPPQSSVALVVSSERGRYAEAESLPLVGSHVCRLTSAGEHAIGIEVRAEGAPARIALAGLNVVVSPRSEP